MTDTETKPHLLRAAEIAASTTQIAHPWNPESEIHGVMLSRATGLSRTGVNLARVPPGKESFVYHSHTAEEEWIYVLSGRGLARIDGVEHEVGPGDFMGFPAPSVAHHLTNPFDQDLVYLMGGENRPLEVCDFPELGRRMVRRGEEVSVYGLDEGTSSTLRLDGAD